MGIPDALCTSLKTVRRWAVMAVARRAKTEKRSYNERMAANAPRNLTSPATPSKAIHHHETSPSTFPLPHLPLPHCPDWLAQSYFEQSENRGKDDKNRFSLLIGYVWWIICCYLLQWKTLYCPYRQCAEKKARPFHLREWVRRLGEVVAVAILQMRLQFTAYFSKHNPFRSTSVILHALPRTPRSRRPRGDVEWPVPTRHDTFNSSCTTTRRTCHNLRAIYKRRPARYDAQERGVAPRRCSHHAARTPNVDRREPLETEIVFRLFHENIGEVRGMGEVDGVRERCMLSLSRQLCGLSVCGAGLLSIGQNTRQMKHLSSQHQLIVV